MTGHPFNVLLKGIQVSARYPRATLGIAALCTVLGAWGAARIHPTASLQAMLSDEDPASRALARVAEEFGMVDTLIVIASVPSESAKEPGDAPDILRAFAQRLEQSVGQSAELSVLCSEVHWREFPQIRKYFERELIPAARFYLDDAALEALRDRLKPEVMRDQFRRNEELISTPGVGGNALGAMILQDPLRLHELLMKALPLPPASLDQLQDGMLLSKDGRSVMVQLTGTRPVTDMNFAKRFTAAIHGAVDQVNHDGLHIAYTGAYAIATTSERSIRRDMIGSIVSTIVCLQLLYLLVYRRWHSFLLAMLPVVMGIVTAFGLSSLYTTQLTPVVAVIGAMLSGMGIDYSIHVLSPYRSERAQGAGHAEALQRTLTDVGPAITAACATSIIGFLVLARSSVQAIRDFSVVGSLGLACIMLAAFTVLPAALSITAGRGGAPSVRLDRLGRALFHGLIEQRRRLCLTLSLTIAIAASAVFAWANGGGLRYETDLTVMHPRPNPPLDAQRVLTEQFAHAADSMIVHLEAESPDKLVILAHEVEDRLRSEATQSVVSGTLGLASVLPDPRVVRHRTAVMPSLDVEQVLADFDSAVTDSIFEPQAYSGYKVFLRTLLTAEVAPNIATLRDYPELAKMTLPAAALSDSSVSREAITQVFLNFSLDERGRRDAAIQTIREALSDLPGATLTGLNVVGHDTEQVIRHDMPRFLAVSLALVALYLLWFYRHAGDTLMALIPVAFALVVLLGTMNLFDLRLNMVNLVVFPLLVGVGVDDGIILVSLARASRGPELLAVGCHAVIMTTLTTVLSMGTLAFTSTPAIQSLGVMMAISMTACLFGSLFLLTPLLFSKSPE